MKLRKVRKQTGVFHFIPFYLNILRNITTVALMSLFLFTPVAADDAVKLKVLVITSGPNDPGLAFIKPHLDEMGVPHDILDASTTSLTAETFSPNGCLSSDIACVGNYNGIILTLSDLGGGFTPSEWKILHQYEKDFNVRESVISGWPGTFSDSDPSVGVYLDYGVTVSSSGTFPSTNWTGSASGSSTVFEYLNTANSLPITDFAFAATPRNDGLILGDGTVPNVEPLLATPNGEALVSIVRYYLPDQPAEPVREVLLSTITNAWFLIHSQALAYEFINFATQGVFVGGRFIYMSAHLDDLFLPNDLWDPNTNKTNPSDTVRLNSHDISNGVSAQNSFRAAHGTVSNQFKLDFPFNGAGAVVDPEARLRDLVIDGTDDLVVSIFHNRRSFRYINHTFTHADMDKAPESSSAPCDYDTLPTVRSIEQQIRKNRRVWRFLDLPDYRRNRSILVTGNHSGLKDRKCTDIPELNPGMFDVQSDDVQYPQGANPLLFQAAANLGVKFLASDSSQPNQDVEHYMNQVNDGRRQDRIMLPRYPANIFFNTVDPVQLADEYNYIFHERFVNNGQDPCTVPGAICTPRNYAQILAAESETALRHMMTTKKWAHYFHQSNLVDYGNGNTLMFDWLNAVFNEYEKLFKLPVKNYPYYKLGNLTKESLKARSATIQATWNRVTNQVTLSANKRVPKLLVTGLQGGELYGGQFIRRININTLPKSVSVNQALVQ